MLKKVTSANADDLRTLLDERGLLNPYFSIDFETYGYDGEDVDAWLVHQDGANLQAALYRYYRSIQFLRFGAFDVSDAKEVAGFIERNRIKMISGDAESLRLVSSYVSCENVVTEGALMRLEELPDKLDDRSEIATLEDLNAAAALICTDEEIGGHYTVDELTAQLVERQESHGCHSRVLFREGVLLCHMATYASGKDVAVLGGLVTAKSARGQGLGKRILGALATDVMREGKTPMLYCYKRRLISWYEMLGWSVVLNCAKMEIFYR